MSPSRKFIAYRTVATTTSPRKANASRRLTARIAAPAATSSQPTIGSCAAMTPSVTSHFVQKSASGDPKSVKRSRNCSAKTRYRKRSQVSGCA